MCLCFEIWSPKLPLKFIFSKKATKIEEIFTVDLTVTTYCQIDGEDTYCQIDGKDFVNFVAFSENVNFTVARGDKKN